MLRIQMSLYPHPPWVRASDILRSRGAAKFWKIHKNMQNTAKFGRKLKSNNVCTAILKLVSAILGVITCRKLANLFQNFITETCKQRSETTRHRSCCVKLGTSHDVKGFTIGSFLERIAVERAK